MTATNDTTTQAPQPAIEQEGSRSDIVTVNYDFERPLHIATSGIRTTNVRIERASTGWLKDHVHVRAQVSSISTTLHGRLHARSDITNGEYSLTLKVDSSLWDLGWTNAEVTIVLPINGDESDNAQLEHPGIRVAVPNGSIGATMLGNTSIRSLELATDHGPAHLSDIAVGSLKLTAHNGNITVHDVCAQDAVEISGKTAWMDIDDVKATSLRATSVDAIISLKDVDAKEVWATTSNARVGLGNIKAGTLSVSTTNAEVFANNVFVDACEVNVEKGDIEGDWSPRKKLYLSTTEAKIAAKVLIDPNESLEMTLRSTKGPVVVDLPATFSGGFSLKTTGFYKTFIHTDPKVKASPVLHVSQPDSKMGVLSSGDMRHSLKVITEEAPVTVNFGSL
ncbi:hypothetical protein IW147_003184 [Coemansia sp. RSA 720]|nr:hypothetical protein LPJ76_005134 [Coemansia sp. RSA 638]KAJ2122774.1 hypothetical protein IW147_003184 [Coemansia sp. RSA 720]KAJ2659536.1 hypothetical protein IW148_004169 [Coemansia sp. RSA 1199]